MFLTRRLTTRCNQLLNEGADVGAKNHWNANCLHWTVKGFVHNQGEEGYEERKVCAKKDKPLVFFAHNLSCMRWQDTC